MNQSMIVKMRNEGVGNDQLIPLPSFSVYSLFFLEFVITEITLTIMVVLCNASFH